jgi:DNA replication protein DnaC
MSPDRVRLLLRSCGLEAREVRNLDLPVLHQLPDVSAGFGLIGPVGIGKTIALAQHLARPIRAFVAGHHDPENATMPFRFARWANWPLAAEELKALSAPSNWAALDSLLESLSTCSRLYLDDLGQERIRGEEDLALGHLRVILDSRYRAELPVFWTSNLGPKELSATYGARTASRMLEAWPPLRIGGDDLRVAAFRRPA